MTDKKQLIAMLERANIFCNILEKQIMISTSGDNHSTTSVFIFNENDQLLDFRNNCRQTWYGRYSK